jgi:DNA repair exonuclease SbcCD ATPase subunit
VIVHRLTARNILKYRSLQLEDLPERGLILVTGPNESGKSSVGETLCLALFGRTFALTPETVEKAVRWDAPAGTVEIDFTSRDGLRARVARTIDLDGMRSASLVDDEGERRGWDAVTRAVEKLLGFTFAEYVESFYLARREIAPPHPRSDTLKAMAGVLKLENIASDFARRITKERARQTDLRGEIAQADRELAQFRRDDLLPPRPGQTPKELVDEAEARVQQLKDVRRQLLDRTPRLEEAIKELIDATAGAGVKRWTHAADRMEVGLDSLEESVSFLGYADASPGTDRLSRAMERIQEGLKSFKSLQDAVVPRRGVLGTKLGKAGYEGQGTTFANEEDDLADEVRALRRRRDSRVKFGGLMIVLAVVFGALGFVPMGLADGLNVVFWVAGGAVLLGSILFGVQSRSLGRRLHGLRADEDDVARRKERAADELEALVGYEGKDLPAAVAQIRKVQTPAIAQALAAFLEGPGGRLVEEGSATKLGQGLGTHLESLQENVQTLHGRIDTDLEALAQIHTLRELRARLELSRESMRVRISTWELSIELIEGACKEITFDFNRSVRQGMARVLPSLTEGRYQYLRIDDELKVRVFSSEKQDFVSFEEISGGTQRQIALATRLALSEALVRNAVHDTQFLFLDEPFAFFDAQRTKNSMLALPKVSDDLTQIWIAAQEAPAGAGAEVHLVCESGGDSLVHNGALA